MIEIDLKDFWQLVILSFMALFPPVNPFGTAIIVDPYLSGLTKYHRIKASFFISVFSLVFCLGTILVGSQIFHLFGISIPAVQLAGGLFIFRMGYETLYSKNDSENSKIDKEKNDPDYIWNKTQSSLFYPLAFPITTGAGTVSVLLTLSADGKSGFSFDHIVRLFSIGLGATFMCVLVFISYSFAPQILRKLGSRRQVVLNRLIGFLTLCVGIQVFLNGVKGFIKDFN
jgi:multiple antibiotic resistance protein